MAIVNPLLNFSYDKNPLIRQSEMNQEIVLEDNIPRSETMQFATGEKRRTCTNSFVANDAVRLKPKGCLVAAVSRSESKV